MTEVLSDLDPVVSEALATEEVRAALADQRLDLTENDLRAHILNNNSRIYDAGHAEIAEYFRLTDRDVIVFIPRRWKWFPWLRRRAAAVARRREIAAKAAYRAWQIKTLEDGVLPVLRALINERLAPFLWTTMQIKDAPGLERVRDSRFVVETASAQRFLNLASQIRSGAIGIAGVRGAGKSTLIEYYQARSPDTISILVAAPVQYNAREFVLHLYAELCQEVIRRFGGAQRARRALLRDRMLLAARYAIVGVVAFAAGALVVGPARLFNAKAWSIAQLWIGGGLLIIGSVGLLAALSVLVATSYRRMLRSLGWLVGASPPVVWESELVGQARDRLRRIRFLQTSTTGWSGKVTIPNGEVALDRSIELAEQPLTYPEVVHDLRQFIGLVATKQGVIVAVDELDKIEGAQEAQAFVNEIKGVFGVTGAQFLVSVSEDALASFERRGLPVRDAFDSAFDEIVRIEPLNLGDSCALLRSRVIGVSDLFSALAHCMAGGLARDIIRIARSMRAVATTDGTIEPVCRELVELDIQRKIHAFGQATGDLEGTPDTTSFIRALRTLHADRAAIEHALPSLLPSGDDNADYRQVRYQAGAYAYHRATVLAVFTADLTPDAFETKRATLDMLAAAKQELGARPQSAWLMLDEFRTAWGLPIVPRESAPAVVTGTPDDPPSR